MGYHLWVFTEIFCVQRVCWVLGALKQAVALCSTHLQGTSFRGNPPPSLPADCQDFSALNLHVSRLTMDWSMLPFWIKTSLQTQERWLAVFIDLLGFLNRATQNIKHRVSLEYLLPAWLFSQGRFSVRLHCQYALKQIRFLAFPRVYLEYFSGTLKLFSKCPSIHSRLNRILAQWASLSFFKSDKQFYSSTA